MRGFNGTLLVCSESTKDFMDGFDKVRVVKGAPDVSILDEVGAYEKVTAIGGGAVIDALVQATVGGDASNVLEFLVPRRINAIDKRGFPTLRFHACRAGDHLGR